MGRPKNEELQQQLLRLVPADGSTIGNKRLRETLGWTPETYQQVKKALVHSKTLQVGRGRGGTVSLVGAQPTTEKNGSERDSSMRKGELALYPKFLNALKLWAADQGWTSHFVEQIAHQGRKYTGGSWTRPDFVVVGYKKYDYTPGVVRDIETFEVKPAGCTIEAVFETAAHSRVATKSYLAINKGEEEEELERFESECQRFGIGLILFPDSGSPDDWEYVVDPMRREPDPAYLERFVIDQIENKDKLRHWL